MSVQPAGAPSPLRIGIVAGEASGDQLGAALIAALRERRPNARFMGVAGPKMAAAGCEAWASCDELAVMGLTEVLHHLPRLIALRRRLRRSFVAAKLDIFIGIDAPEFNLGLARALKNKGLRTVQYVSPQVWAWRQGRVRTIGRAVDLVLCLLPFEAEFFTRHGMKAVFVGHPLADQIPLNVDAQKARQSLGIGTNSRVVALLPGSRMGEVERLGAAFISAAAWIATRLPDTIFLAPMASARVRALFEGQLASASPQPNIRLIEGRAHAVLAAADGVIVASGTATLETLLSKRPMVVAYRLGGATAFLLRRLGLVKVPYFSQPNLLLGRRRVPELFQEAVSGEALGAALLSEMQSPEQVSALQREFLGVHESLRRGGAERAAAAILECAGAGP
jgi:lipid-A-disaccharide synthase